MVGASREAERPMSNFETLRKEWDVIRQAPLSFGAMAIVVASITGFTVNFIERAQVSAAEERTSLYSDCLKTGILSPQCAVLTGGQSKLLTAPGTAHLISWGLSASNVLLSPGHALPMFDAIVDTSNIQDQKDARRLIMIVRNNFPVDPLTDAAIERSPFYLIDNPVVHMSFVGEKIIRFAIGNNALEYYVMTMPMDVDRASITSIAMAQRLGGKIVARGGEVMPMNETPPK